MSHGGPRLSGLKGREVTIWFRNAHVIRYVRGGSGLGSGTYRELTIRLLLIFLFLADCSFYSCQTLTLIAIPGLDCIFSRRLAVVKLPLGFFESLLASGFSLAATLGLWLGTYSTPTQKRASTL